jgi:hypothetical protein
MQVELNIIPLESTDKPWSSAANIPVDSAPAEAVSGGSYFVWTADMNGKPLQPRPEGSSKTSEPPRQDPLVKEARQIMYTLNDAGQQPPSSEQLELVAEFEKVIHVLNHLYPPGDPDAESKFRLRYRTVFGLSRVSLQKVKGYNAETAKKTLDTIKADLINHEAPRIKNTNIKEQLRWAAWIAGPAAAAYVILSRVPDNGVLATWLTDLGANRATVANFMLLWVGCCLGVSLSYALRKSVFTLDDLVDPESDYLTPAIRVALTGTLAMLLVMLSMLKIVNISFADHSLSQVADAGQAMLAFVVGVICGIGEKLLSGTILTKSEALVGGIKKP